MKWAIPDGRPGHFKHLVDDCTNPEAWCGFKAPSWHPSTGLDWARPKCPQCLAKGAKVVVGVLLTGLEAESHPSTPSTFELESWTETIDPRPSTSDKDKIPF